MVKKLGIEVTTLKPVYSTALSPDGFFFEEEQVPFCF
jgi:hypothetical protein